MHKKEIVTYCYKHLAKICDFASQFNFSGNTIICWSIKNISEILFELVDVGFYQSWASELNKYFPGPT